MTRDIQGIARGARRITFSSATQALVTITSVAGDVVLPSVVVPAGQVHGAILRVICMLSWRATENTNAIINKLNGVQDLQVKLTGGAFVDAINLPDDAFQVAATSVAAGTSIPGSIDVKSTITGSGTYEFQLDEAIADQNNLLLRDVQTHIIMEVGN